MSPLFLTILCMALCINAEEYDFEAFIVGIFVYQSELDVNLEVIKPALELAIRKANQDYSRIKFNIVFRNGSTSCTANFAGVFAAEEYYLKKVTAFVGPACSLALDPVGRMAAYWNVPVFTAGGIDTKFADKTTFSTLTRLSLSLDSTGCFILQVLKEFRWRHVAIIVDDSDLQSLLLKAGIVHSLRKSDDTFFLVVREFSSKDRDFNYTQILKESSTKARVFILLATGDTVRKILLDAYEMNMGNGEYTFLSIELIKNHRSSDLVWYKSGDDKNKESRKIFEALMIVAVRVPTSQEYKFFAEEVIKMSKTEFNTKLDATAVNPIVAAFYDCILMYAWALNRSLEEKHDPNDGFTLSRKLWNNTFLRGLTEPIYINENGDREADYTLNDLDPITGVMRPVATYFGAKKIYERIEEVAIHWPGRTQQPPPDVPECGFTGDAAHCLDEVPFPIFACIGIIFFILILVGILIGFHLYRKIKFESTLSDLWWRVRWEDIIFAERVGGVKSLGSIVDDPNRRLAPSISNQSTLEESEVGKVTIGIYKGVQVAIETFNVKKLVVNRMLLLQMKQMRELTHENLVRFIGMCIEEPNIAIITEYSPRGSLQDIIHNGAMKIDWVFRYAMISDIVEGMVFLHSSVISYHGRFKSTNCVIDGRFVVKITDYGMNSLYSQITNEDRIDPKKFFWTAPEHLRDMHPEKQGSKKGDVYSFAIILQEIITRTGPFERIVKKQNLLPEDILEKVKMGTTPPFRPELSPEEATSEILDLMRKCWAEQPDDRPTFQEIKTQLKQITKGISSRNFLDNLLSRMEQYANNLEQLVEEKTLSLIDEKKKTDELLYQLLPKYIADELKKGNHIKPEAFESVTIFFSDIVGFTPLAAESTPIQVVDLLNDLYTCFDDIIDHYSAYKVETIGDAYMVVSGLPIRNGNEHAKEIALMSLSLLRAIRKFKVRHRNDRKLQVRIGIHSGPCAAGVVGLKMPRYCLFGDTVNTASRMESNGQAMKIHVSSDTKIILDIFGTFKLSLRGDIEIKGKGIMRTYWLEGETGDSHFGKE